MIKNQFRSKFYKNVNDAMIDYYNYQIPLNLDNFNQLQKIDKSNLVVSNICVKSISQFQFACILNKKYLE